MVGLPDFSELQRNSREHEAERRRKAAAAIAHSAPIARRAEAEAQMIERQRQIYEAQIRAKAKEVAKKLKDNGVDPNVKVDIATHTEKEPGFFRTSYKRKIHLQEQTEGWILTAVRPGGQSGANSYRGYVLLHDGRLLDYQCKINQLRAGGTVQCTPNTEALVKPEQIDPVTGEYRFSYSNLGIGEADGLVHGTDVYAALAHISP